MTETSFDVIYYKWGVPTVPSQLTSMIDIGAKAFVIEGYHSGTLHACSPDGKHCQYNAVPFLETARQRLVPVFLTFGYFVGDEDNEHGYAPFDAGQGLYVTSNRMLAAGIVPLRANWQQSIEVCTRLEEIAQTTQDYNRLIAQMYQAYPFKTSLKDLRALAQGGLHGN